MQNPHPKLIQEVRFSATVAPFYRTTAFNVNDKNAQPSVAMYGSGWLPAVDTTYPPTLLTSTFQNAPLLATPVPADASNTRGNFHALTNALYHLSCRPVPSYSGNTNERSTNIGFYRNPLIYYP